MVRCAMAQALCTRQLPPGTISHSDRNSEFLAFEIAAQLQLAGPVHSVNRFERLADNAQIASWYKALKSNLHHQYRSLHDQ